MGVCKQDSPEFSVACDTPKDSRACRTGSSDTGWRWRTHTVVATRRHLCTTFQIANSISLALIVTITFRKGVGLGVTRLSLLPSSLHLFEPGLYGTVHPDDWNR